MQSATPESGALVFAEEGHEPYSASSEDLCDSCSSSAIALCFRRGLTLRLRGSGWGVKRASEMLSSNISEDVDRDLYELIVVENSSDD